MLNLALRAAPDDVFVLAPHSCAPVILEILAELTASFLIPGIGSCLHALINDSIECTMIVFPQSRLQLLSKYL